MSLFLDTSIPDYFRLTPVQKAGLKKLGIDTVEDLLYHFPVRYGDTAEAKNIDSLQKGDTAVIYGKITGLKASKGFRTKVTMADGYVEDETGRIHCVWFNQPYLAKMTTEGALVRIEGKVSQRRSGASKKAQGAQNTQENEAGGELYFSNPKIETVSKLPTGVGDSLFGEDGESHTLYPVYAESRGISSLWIYHILQKIFKLGILDQIVDPLPGHILVKYHLPSLKTALIWIHTPKKRDDALSARKRFAFEEVFTIQLGKQRARKEYEAHPSFEIETDMKQVQEFIRRFPFQATNAQMKAVETIVSDMKKGHAMSRLLEGDVGSGKTAVAAATTYAVMTARGASEKAQGAPKPQTSSRPLQIAYMCPTEILATQQFESFIQYFSYMPIQIALITGSGCRKFPSKVNPKGWTDISRAQLLKWVADGSVAVVIGTHALIQKSVQFRNLAYVIIDEQHRFGTMQRARLVKKGSEEAAKRQGRATTIDPADDKEIMSARSSLLGVAGRGKPIDMYATPTKGLRNLAADLPAPHLLSMTATPIPRTLALTMYGDLDLTLLDESPAGRKPITTQLILPSGRAEIYEKVRQELKAGRQAYVICPRIDEPDPDKEQALNAKSVKEEAKRLKASVFPEYEIGILHSKLKPNERDETIQRFKEEKMQILCATSVIEVGVNIPNATVILIEGAERFGLAQLHQLRGRVMRSTHQSYCYVFTETTSEKSIARLKALQTAKNGFELAELDLGQRGAGTLSGMRQWGVSDVAMEALKNLKMVEAARTEATRLVIEDVTLSKYPDLKKVVDKHAKESHFE